MSADASVVIPFGGEERRFRLAIGELRELQQAVNKNRGANPIGPWSLLQLIGARDAWIDDLRDVIRLGLIGGGTRLELVPGLVKKYVDERPLMESGPVAFAILATALVGDQSDQIAKKKPDETAATTLSDSAKSTDQAPQWDSRREKSTSVQSGNSQHVSRDTIEPTAQATPSLTQ